MRTLSIVMLLVGLALLTGLVVWQGWDVVASMLWSAGGKLLLLPLFFLAPLALGTVAWLSLFDPAHRPSFAAAVYANWAAFSVNAVLPAAQIGGELVRSRLIHKAGIPGTSAIATVVVDKTIQAMTQPVFALVGLCLFALGGGDGDIILSSSVFIALLGGGIFGFYRVQRAGIFGGLARFAARPRWWSAAASLGARAEEVDAAIHATYDARARFLTSCVWRMVFRATLVFEIWFAAGFFGHPMSLLDALILESLTQIVVAAAFMVPGALGIQEGGFMLMAATLGLGPEVGLSLSLARRFRELLVGIPGVIVWQLHEGRNFLVRRPASPPPGDGETV